MKQKPAWPGPMWQWRAQRKQCSLPCASGSHQRASWSFADFWRMLRSCMGAREMRPPSKTFTSYYTLVMRKELTAEAPRSAEEEPEDGDSVVSGDAARLIR